MLQHMLELGTLSKCGDNHLEGSDERVMLLWIAKLVSTGALVGSPKSRRENKSKVSNSLNQEKEKGLWQFL